MSIRPRKPDEGGFFGPALTGVCLAVVLSVPVAAYTASFFGDTYEVRAAVYGLLLLWVVTGSILIFVRTYKKERKLPTPGRVLLWFASVWLWLLLLVFGKRRD